MNSDTLLGDKNDDLPNDLLSAIAAEPRQSSTPWFAYMALRERKERKDAQKTKASSLSSSSSVTPSKRKCGGAGNRVVLRVSEWPFDDIEKLNQSGTSRGLHHLSEYNMDDRSTDVGFNPYTDSASTCITPKNMVYTGSRGKGRSYKSSTRSKLSAGRKSRHGKGRSCEYKPAMIVGDFKNKEEAELFCMLWNHKSRGLIPRTAWGEVIAEHFKINIYSDLDMIFNEKREHWKLEKVDGKWVVVKRGAPQRKTIELSCGESVQAAQAATEEISKDEE